MKQATKTILVLAIIAGFAVGPIAFLSSDQQTSDELDRLWKESQETQTKCLEEQIAKFDFGDGKGPVPAHQHPNGGGWVANTATVEATVYVGPNATVYGEASVTDFVRIDDLAQVSGKAQVSGHVRVYAKARVTGNAWVLHWSRVAGRSLVGGQARLVGSVLVLGCSVLEPQFATIIDSWVGQPCANSNPPQIFKLRKARKKPALIPLLESL